MYHHLWLLFRFLLVQCEVFPLVRCFQLVSATVQNQPRYLLLDLNGRQECRQGEEKISSVERCGHDPDKSVVW